MRLKAITALNFSIKAGEGLPECIYTRPWLYVIRPLLALDYFEVLKREHSEHFLFAYAAS
jgi:hypothetical protein